MNVEAYVEIPADKLRLAISTAYDLSVPQGMGFIHFRDGPLDEATIDLIVVRGHDLIAASMDYVHGCACKMAIWRHEERLYVEPRWFDHTGFDLVRFLEKLDVAEPAAKIDAAIAAERC